MRHTREEFIRRWRVTLTGLALCGSASEARESPMARAAKALDLPAEMEQLLGRMYDDLAPKVPAVNGTAAPPPPRKVAQT